MSGKDFTATIFLFVLPNKDDNESSQSIECNNWILDWIINVVVVVVVFVNGKNQVHYKLCQVCVFCVPVV